MLPLSPAWNDLPGGSLTAALAWALVTWAVAGNLEQTLRLLDGWRRSTVIVRDHDSVFIGRHSRLYRALVDHCLAAAGGTSRGDVVTHSGRDDDTVFVPRGTFRPRPDVRVEFVEDPDAQSAARGERGARRHQARVSSRELTPDALLAYVREVALARGVRMTERSLYLYEDGCREKGVALTDRVPDFFDVPAEDVLAEVARFLAPESLDRYRRFGRPLSRGYLLHGPPGTGKTTLIRAVAARAGASVYSLNLSSLKDDNDVLRAFARLGGGTSVLCVEDVDRSGAHLARLLPGLLNAIDGLAGAEAPRLIFLTANDPGGLPEALRRAGRIDREVELGAASPAFAERLGAPAGGRTVAELVADHWASAKYLDG